MDKKGSRILARIIALVSALRRMFRFGNTKKRAKPGEPPDEMYTLF